MFRIPGQTAVYKRRNSQGSYSRTCGYGKGVRLSDRTAFKDKRPWRADCGHSDKLNVACTNQGQSKMCCSAQSTTNTEIRSVGRFARLTGPWDPAFLGAGFFQGALCRALRQRPPFACAVRRRRFPMGESLTRRPLQPEATGAVMELTKWLKPSVWLVTYRGQREGAGGNASERRASLT